MNGRTEEQRTKQNEQKAEWIQDTNTGQQIWDNDYKTTGSTGWILRLQEQCHESSQDIAGSYYALKGYSASGQGGSSWSSPLRSDSSRDDQAWEAGPGRAEAQWRPRVSELRAKGLFDYHSHEIAAEAARREARGPS
jgi:hypothetical protein